MVLIGLYILSKAKVLSLLLVSVLVRVETTLVPHSYEIVHTTSLLL